MGNLKLGPTKKSKRKTGTTSSQSSKKAKIELEPKVVPKVKSARSRNKSSKRSTVDIVQNDAPEISDGDIEDFDEYQHFQGFLETLDPGELARKTQKQSNKVVAKIPLSLGRTNDGISQKQSDSDEQISSSESGSQFDTASEPSYDGQADEIDSGDEDVNSINDSDVQEIAPKGISSKKDFDHLESTYAQKNRSSAKATAEVSNRLPIILRDGRVQPLVVQPLASDPISAKTPPERTADVPSVEERTVSKPENESFLQLQERLARVALEIIEDPEENILKLSKIKELQQNGNVLEQKFAILSLSAIFKDIIPGYRIRPLTEVEKNEKTTKEVRKLRNFEQTLVAYYQDFTKSLVKLTKVSRKQTNLAVRNPLKDIAITAACSLLSAVPHFNFRTELVSILVSQVVRRKVDSSFVKCRECLENFVREDEEGEASFEATRLLCKKMKDREFQIDQSTIEIFLHLRLLTEMEDRGSTRKVDREKIKKKDRLFRTKKLKKLVKDQKEVDRDMREAEAEVNTETRQRLQGETLKLVFTTYFRILKEGNRTIMGAALEGLAKFAHLINVDFFGDLLEVLKELMQDQASQYTLSTRETLLCIVTAFTLLSEQGASKETISLDLSRFMDSLYACIINLAFNTDIELSERRTEVTSPSQEPTAQKLKVNVSTEAELLLRALDAVFFKHRVQGSSRLSAFVKRLSTASMNFPEKSAAATLELTKRLVIRYSKLYSLYSTEESAGDGVYNGETDNPELSNPAATTIWELALYRKHFSPKVTQAAQSLLDSLNDASANRR